MVILKEYQRSARYQTLLLIVGAVLLIVVGTVISTYNTGVSWYDLPHILWKYMNDGYMTGVEKIIAIMRVPRVVMAIVAGAGLSIAGAVMQSLTRNYLVSPFTLGVSSSAAFGASMCIVFGYGIFHTEIGIVGSAFICACLCTMLVYSLSKYAGMSASALILVGIAMNYFFSAMNATIEFFANEYKLGEIVQWSFGTLNKANWNVVAIAFVVVLLSYFYFLRESISLNVIAQNDDEGTLGLGVNPDRIRLLGGGVSVLITATIISFTGVIGFIGLVGPHIARLLLGNDHRVFIPLSALCGAWLLMISDVVGKYILYPVNIPVGIVISFIGVPLFVNLILTARKVGK